MSEEQPTLQDETGAPSDQQFAKEIRQITAKLNDAIFDAVGAGLSVDIDTRVRRSVIHKNDIPTLLVKVSRVL